MSRATRPHRHLIYTRNAITTVCMQHAPALGPTPAQASRFSFTSFLLTPILKKKKKKKKKKKRWKQAALWHFSLPKRKPKFCVNVDCWEISPFSTAYSKTFSKHISLSRTGGAELGVHTQVCIHEPSAMHTNTQTHKQYFYGLISLSVILSYTSK